ncbi:hypothetical protein L7F22_014083 [Adiantum nelumboides]|nr:hypothetical protein [Adiantum nelumboides]
MSSASPSPSYYAHQDYFEVSPISEASLPSTSIANQSSPRSPRYTTPRSASNVSIFTILKGYINRVDCIAYLQMLQQRSANNVLSSVTSTGTYGLQESQRAACLDVVRATRIWYGFEFPELQVPLKAEEGENHLVVNIERTKGGFCHVTEVVADTAADRAGLSSYLWNAQTLEKLLLVTRVGDEKILPWLISDEYVSCFVHSICTKLPAYRDAHHPAFIHILAAPTTKEALSPAIVFHYGKNCAA